MFQGHHKDMNQARTQNTWPRHRNNSSSPPSPSFHLGSSLSPLSTIAVTPVSTGNTLKSTSNSWNSTSNSWNSTESSWKGTANYFQSTDNSLKSTGNSLKSTEKSSWKSAAKSTDNHLIRLFLFTCLITCLTPVDSISRHQIKAHHRLLHRKVTVNDDSNLLQPHRRRLDMSEEQQDMSAGRPDMSRHLDMSKRRQGLSGHLDSPRQRPHGDFRIDMSHVDLVGLKSSLENLEAAETLASLKNLEEGRMSPAQRRLNRNKRQAVESSSTSTSLSPASTTTTACVCPSTSTSSTTSSSSESSSTTVGVTTSDGVCICPNDTTIEVETSTALPISSVAGRRLRRELLDMESDQNKSKFETKLFRNIHFLNM